MADPTSRGHDDAASPLSHQAPQAAPASASATTAQPTTPPRARRSGEKNIMNGPLYTRIPKKNVMLVRRVKRKDEGTFSLVTRLFVENQIGLSFNLIALLFLAHACIPKARPTTRKFLSLSYQDPETGLYGIGHDDAYFITFFIVLFTGLRAATMEYLLAPIAKWKGVTKRKDLTRFSEQAWLLVYYSAFWPLGVYIYYNSKYFLNLRELWTDWPSRDVTGVTKWYLLAQWAFWLQQILVINIEERRKDHWLMFSHHVVTISLIWACYGYHFSRVGNLVLVLMDVVDIFLPLAKCLKYMGYKRICDVIFGVFLVSWVAARHVCYIMVCWSIYTHLPAALPVGCFTGHPTAPDGLTGPHPIPSGYSYVLEPLYKPHGQVCFSPTVQWGFLSPLLFLQLLTLMWFVMIMRVAVRVIRGKGAEDTRSDDEAEREEEEEEEEEVLDAVRFAKVNGGVFEEEVGVEDIDFKNWSKRNQARNATGAKRAATSSGVHLPGHSDRKELLGRIGCEKQVD